jgi:dTDP-4-dehydrorhamnose 3,5-epimerase
MRAIPTALDGVLILEPRVVDDERGFFFESYNARQFAELTGLELNFVQDNHSKSVKNVVRGLHYQVRRPQGKLVRIVAGAVYDVVVDLRRSSPSFGRWTGALLSAANRRQVWVPPGFAHGFVTLSDSAECLYKTTDYWSPPDERTLLWNDPALQIAWPLDGAAIVSSRDRAGALLRDIEVFA